MPNQTFTVKTDLNPEQLTEVAMETYRLWLSWAMGQDTIGAKVLAHPSGRYAASLSWRHTGAASVAIIADESVAPEALWLEEGTNGFNNLKALMLAGAKTSKEGYKYRVIPIRNDGSMPENSTPKIIENRLGGRMQKHQGKIWAENRPSGAQRFRVMTDKPGSAQWLLPPMTPYTPAKILSELLAKEYGNQS